MKIYFSVDPEVTDVASLESARKLMKFLQDQGHSLYRAPYVLSADPEGFLRKETGLDHNPTFPEQREIHFKWIDEADLLLADLTVKSEGMTMIIQRALDKPQMGLNVTPIILIRDKNKERKFGKIVRGLIESGKVVYYEYYGVEEVMNSWPEILAQANSK